MSTSELTYPHTTISEELSNIAEHSERWGSDAKHILDMYDAKRTYFTARIAELEAALEAATSSTASNTAPAQEGGLSGLPPYPHTNITSDLAALEQSLEKSGSPEREARLALVRSARAGYALKSNFLRALRARVGI